MRLIDLTHTSQRKPDPADAPPLMLRSAVSVDRLALESLVTAATVVDVSSRPLAARVRRSDLSAAAVADIPGCILCSGWMDSRLNGDAEEPPIMDIDAAAYLLEGGVRMIAADFPIAAEAGDLLLHNNCVLVYCISNVDELSSRIVRLAALPLKLKDTSSAQARVIAFEE